eukprot:364326-Chlamydomonas_euryale.AAC.22
MALPRLCPSSQQASSAKQNYVAFVKLDALGQGRHGKKAKKGDEDDEDEDDDDMSSSDDESVADDNGGEPPPKMHYRMVNHGCGVNRVRSCPQRPSLVAVWGDNGQVGAPVQAGGRRCGRCEPSASTPAARVDCRSVGGQQTGGCEAAAGRGWGGASGEGGGGGACQRSWRM